MGTNKEADVPLIAHAKTPPENETTAPHPRELFLAIRHGDAEEVARLFERGANPNWKDRRGEETALAYAALVSTATVVRVLVSHGATDEGRMPFENAVSWNEPGGNPDSTKIARVLLEYGGDVNQSDEWGVTPLMAASEAGDVKTAQLFLGCGANVHAKAKSGATALSIALFHNHLAIAELLRQAEIANRAA